MFLGEGLLREKIGARNGFEKTGFEGWWTSVDLKLIDIMEFGIVEKRTHNRMGGGL